MATIRYYLQKKEGNAPIYIRFSISRDILLRRKTGLYINSKDWSSKTNFPKTNTEENKLIISKLHNLTSFINDKFNKDNGKGLEINNDWLVATIDKFFNRVKKTDLEIFTNYIQTIIDDAPTRENQRGKIGLSKSTVKNYRMFKNIILAYEKEKNIKIKFSDINVILIENFKKWLLIDKAYSKNYAGRQLEFIKTVCLDAQKKENFEITEYSKKIKTFRQSKEERYINTLSFDDLDKIYNTEMPTPHLKEVKKWILLGCYIGQRGGDLLRLTKNNLRIIDNIVYIDLIQQKTGKAVTVPIVEEFIRDIVLYNFPKKVSLNKINPYIKKVCEIAGINEIAKGYIKNDITGRLELKSMPKYNFITSHSFRRSFATNYYKKIPTPILIGITAHNEEAMFLKYINRQSDKDDNAKLFIKHLEEMKGKDEQKPAMKVLRKI